MLWRPIEGKLQKKKFVVDACFQLHNFIIDERELEQSSENGAEFSQEEEMELLNKASEEFGLQNSGGFHSLFLNGKNATPYNLHYQNVVEETELRNEGIVLRNQLRDELWSKGFRRTSEGKVSRRDKYNRVVDPDL